MDKEEPIVLVTNPAEKVPTLGRMAKQEDSLLNKTHWTQADIDLLIRICDHYIDTRYGGSRIEE